MKKKEEIYTYKNPIQLVNQLFNLIKENFDSNTNISLLSEPINKLNFKLNKNIKNNLIAGSDLNHEDWLKNRINVLTQNKKNIIVLVEKDTEQKYNENSIIESHMYEIGYTEEDYILYKYSAKEQLSYLKKNNKELIKESYVLKGNTDTICMWDK